MESYVEIQILKEDQWTKVDAGWCYDVIKVENLRRLQETNHKLPCRVLCSRFSNSKTCFVSCPARDQHTRIMYENVGVLNDMLQMEGKGSYHFFYHLELLYIYDNRHLDERYDPPTIGDYLVGNLSLYNADISLFWPRLDIYSYRNSPNNKDVIDRSIEIIGSSNPDFDRMIRMSVDEYISFEKEQEKKEQENR